MCQITCGNKIGSGKHLTATEIAVIKVLFDEGCTQSEISRKVGRSRGAVRNEIRRKRAKKSGAIYGSPRKFGKKVA